MSDERIVETLKERLTKMDEGMAPAWTDGQVRTLLAALREAGFEVYRPEEFVGEFGLRLIRRGDSVTPERAVTELLNLFDALSDHTEGTP